MKGKKWLRKTTALCAAAVLGAAAVPTHLPKRKPGRNLWLNSLLLMLNP